MQYIGLSVVVAVLALLTLLVALRLLINRHWLLGWLRGTCGLALVALAGAIGLVAYDVGSYEALPEDQPLATVSFQADGIQRYRVKLQQGLEERAVTLEGDLWQLDLRVLRWKSLATLIGLESGYRIDRLAGRYLAVEQQDQARYPQVVLSESPLGVDFWRWLRLCQCDPFFLQAQARRVSFMPIVDGAIYTISLAPSGLTVKPINAAAKQALKSW